MRRKGSVGSLSLCFAVAFVGLCAAAYGAEPVDIGSRLELFVDELLVDHLRGDARLHLHKPEPQEVVLTTDAPWEGNTSAYFTVFHDGDLYRMYYRGSHYDTTTRKRTHREVTCYAESTDGIRWTKPELGLFEFEGSKANNIIWDGQGTHNFTPFKDANPDCPPEARYKALAGGGGGLRALQSADGIRWSLMAEKAVITKGAFDSQNLAFWDAARGRYADYHRGFRDGVRDIMTCTSADFLTWTEPEWLEYPGAPKEHLYTNAILPYERAPHILIGFPTRYLPKTQQVEPTLMAGRDGRTFHRWTEAIIPVTAPEDREGNRSNYMAWGMLRLPGADRELSMYASEAYYTGPDSRMRRFTYRVDGFVSLRANAEGGELLTRPITFAGGKLVLNFATGEGGSVRVEVQDAGGTPIDGFALADCAPLSGDEIDHAVRWQTGGDLRALAGRPIRLRIVLANADVYSLRFTDSSVLYKSSTSSPRRRRSAR
ncbi:MAG: hypothetical protein RBS80_23330 [Thermoguttaceae bacterium]|nr:hypothetical protein [Thermoguttaceae bacterium]